MPPPLPAALVLPYVAHAIVLSGFLNDIGLFWFDSAVRVVAAALLLNAMTPLIDSLSKFCGAVVHVLTAL